MPPGEPRGLLLAVPEHIHADSKHPSDRRERRQPRVVAGLLVPDDVPALGPTAEGNAGLRELGPGHPSGLTQASQAFAQLLLTAHHAASRPRSLAASAAARTLRLA